MTEESILLLVLFADHVSLLWKREERSADVVVAVVII